MNQATEVCQNVRVFKENGAVKAIKCNNVSGLHCMNPKCKTPLACERHSRKVGDHVLCLYCFYLLNQDEDAPSWIQQSLWVALGRSSIKVTNS